MHPEKYEGRAAFLRALRAGELVRPARCELCGAGGRIEGHHFKGYARRYWLTVEWLCVRCHRGAHA
jgi:hypothetical protein